MVEHCLDKYIWSILTFMAFALVPAKKLQSLEYTSKKDKMNVTPGNRTQDTCLEGRNFTTKLA
jgi:hypothetical protein